MSHTHAEKAVKRVASFAKDIGGTTQGIAKALGVSWETARSITQYPEKWSPDYPTLLRLERLVPPDFKPPSPDEAA
jgi:hypothetical protein